MTGPSTLAQLMLVTPQSSEAPTAGSQPGIVSGLQPRFVLAGQLVNTGPVVSTTHIVWSQVATLVQASVAFHVRVIMVLVGHVPGALASLKVMTGLPLQLSVAVAVPVMLVPVWPHCAVVSGGHVIIGRTVFSTQETICVQVALLLQISVAV